MRSEKVKLVGQMREENKKFRTWLLQKEREVAQLKDKDQDRIISLLTKQLLPDDPMHKSPPKVPKHCRCMIGGCVTCVCVKGNRNCNQACRCKASGNCKNAAKENVLQQIDLNRVQPEDNQNRMLDKILNFIHWTINKRKRTIRFAVVSYF